MAQPKTLTPQEQRKALETYYATEFLRKVGLSYELEPREAPDFLMRTPNGVVGLEITQLYKDERADGSPHKKLESRRVHYLRGLAATYYEMGGKPTYVTANLSWWNLDPELFPHLARRLIRRRPSATPAYAEFAVKTKHYLEIAKFYQWSLADGAGSYSNWTCVNNSVGSVWPIQDKELTRKIEEKADKLPDYRKAVEQTILLIVAEHTQESGMFSFGEREALLPNRGFFQVHLFIHPLETRRIG